MKKEYRVKRNTEIVKIIQKRDSVGDVFFVIYKSGNLHTGHFRYAISVSKKYGIAVQRNLIKRRVREIVDATKFIESYDFLIVIKPAASKLSFAEISTDLHKLFARAKITEGKHEEN